MFHLILLTARLALAEALSAARGWLTGGLARVLRGAAYRRLARLWLAGG